MKSEVTRTGSVALVFCLLASWNPISAQQKGSVEAYRAANRAASIDREQDENWRKATKLRVDASIQIPERPTQGEQPKDLQDGQVGDLAYWNFEVLDIVSPKQVLLILGSSTVILLDDHPTTGLVTDQSVRLVGPVRVDGTYSYESAVGQEIVRKVRFLSAMEVAEIHLAKAEAEEAKLYREFTDSSGKYKFVGKLIEYKGGQAHFTRKDDAKTISVKLSQLSASDRKWVAEELKLRKEQAKHEKTDAP